MNSELQKKLENLKDYLRDLESVAIAYSSGVDSTFLLKVAGDVLGNKAIAITVNSSFFPERERSEASEFCQKNGIKHITATVNVLGIEKVADNPPDRCYLCKRALFTKMKEIAAEQGIENLAEGSNLDDEGDYRPGLKAIAELHIESPLRECSFTKEDIRSLSKELGLDTWDKPSYACLASRVPYGEKLTPEKLSMIEKSEDFLTELGFGQSRVRHHGDVARIELLPQEFDKLMDKEVREKVYSELNRIGFKYVTLDIRGFRTGSMNEVLQWTKEK